MRIGLVYKVLALLFLVTGFYACEPDDAPSLVRESVSRLYVSFEEYGTNPYAADSTIRVLDPADSTVFQERYSFGHVSMARGGGVIYFNPFLKSLVQASSNYANDADTSVYAMGLDRQGRLINNGRLSSRLFNAVQGIAYHSATENLYLTNADQANPAIYVVNRPAGKSGFTKPLKKFLTPGMQLGRAVLAHGHLFVLSRGAQGGIYVYEDIVTKHVNFVDSTATLTPTKFIDVQGAQSLTGIAYDSIGHILALSDYNATAPQHSGRILLFDNFMGQQPPAALVPSRIVGGPSTLMQQPSDIALDPRRGASFFYVADKMGRKVLRFSAKAQGDVAPESYVDTELSPVSLSLDARDSTTLSF